MADAIKTPGAEEISTLDLLLGRNIPNVLKDLPTASERAGGR